MPKAQLTDFNTSTGDPRMPSYLQPAPRANTQARRHPDRNLTELLRLAAWVRSRQVVFLSLDSPLGQAHVPNAGPQRVYASSFQQLLRKGEPDVGNRELQVSVQMFDDWAATWLGKCWRRGHRSSLAQKPASARSPRENHSRLLRLRLELSGSAGSRRSAIRNDLLSSQRRQRIQL
jgi:hypothetical protein